MQKEQHGISTQENAGTSNDKEEEFDFEITNTLNNYPEGLSCSNLSTTVKLRTPESAPAITSAVFVGLSIEEIAAAEDNTTHWSAVEDDKTVHESVIEDDITALGSAVQNSKHKKRKHDRKSKKKKKKKRKRRKVHHSGSDTKEDVEKEDESGER